MQETCQKLDIRYGWTDTDFAYDCTFHQVRIPDVLYFGEKDFSILDMLCLLHEYGHAYYGHKRSDATEQEIIAQETQAWRYAKRCLKTQYHALCDIVAEYHVSTYRLGMVCASKIHANNATYESFLLRR